MLLDIKTGKFHGLNRIASELIAAIKNNADLDEWAAETAQQYNVPVSQVTADAQALTAQLVDLCLIECTTDQVDQE